MTFLASSHTSIVPYCQVGRGQYHQQAVQEDGGDMWTKCTNIYNIQVWTNDAYLMYMTLCASTPSDWLFSVSCPLALLAAGNNNRARGCFLLTVCESPLKPFLLSSIPSHTGFQSSLSHALHPSRSPGPLLGSGPQPGPLFVQHHGAVQMVCFLRLRRILGASQPGQELYSGTSGCHASTIHHPSH